jgi:hypothetical protein
MFTVKNMVKVLLVLVILMLFYFNKVFIFHASRNSVDRMEVRVENELVAQAPYHLFWFGLKENTFKLHYNSFLGKQPLSLFALTKKDEIVMVPPQSRQFYRFGNDYSGTVAAVIPPVRVDFNDDGRQETIQLSAKVDTLFVQGFNPPRTTFGDPRIPFEVCYNKGRQSILLLFNNQPLINKKVRLISRRGLGLAMDKIVTTDAAGMVRFNDIRHLRTGINVMYLAGDQTRYIASYLLEGRTFFTGRYRETVAPLVKSTYWAVLLALLLIAGQKVYWWRVRTMASGQAADGLSDCFGKVTVTK